MNCDGCKVEVQFLITITCIWCMRGIDASLCRDHLTDPGPLLLFIHECEKMPIRVKGRVV